MATQARTDQWGWMGTHPGLSSPPATRANYTNTQIWIFPRSLAQFQTQSYIEFSKSQINYLR
jgi:hypothetical protein